MKTADTSPGSIGHDNCNVLRCYSVVRVYVKVQCGGLVLRLDEKGIVALLSEFNGSVECAILCNRPIGDGDFFDVAASCRHSSLSPYIIRQHFLRHRHSHTSATNAITTSTKIVIG